MLQTLSIHDFVIVNQLDLEFNAGFTVLTGETGAGKSILIDALSLALGARNEGDVVRKNSEKAEISAAFDLSDVPDATLWLSENELLNDARELLVRRVIYADGRSRAFINGMAATVAQLKELGEFLVDIYSQNAHHSLLKTATQRAVLDEFGGLTDTALQVAQHYKTWKNLHDKCLELAKNAEAITQERAELRDNVRELKAIAPTVDEWQELQAEHTRLSHGAALLSGGEACRELLSEGEVSATQLLNQAQQKLVQLTEFDTQLGEANDAVNAAMIQLEEADRFLKRYLQRAELDPQRLNETENRIQEIHAGARKYRVRPEELADLLESWQFRLAELESFADDGTLARQEREAHAIYKQSSQQLSAARRKAASQLSQQISHEMQRLSLSGGRFSVALTECEPGAHGLENIEFLVAGHAGVEPRPLSKVASGGELSRISLAIRVVTAQQGSVPTMIFDEVDVGIGGGVAEVVGNLLAQLGDQRQVLVITHLPQVAAKGTQHLRVAKTQANGQTLSTITPLNQTDRIEEIARMLGGIEITETTRQHAVEMLAQ